MAAMTLRLATIARGVPLAALALSLPLTAAADPMPITMDRISDDPRLGLEFGLVSVDNDGLFRDDFFAGRFDLSGHFVTPQGIGGYGSIVGAMTIGAPGDDQSALQGIELGGLFRLSSASADWWLRAGLVLDTAADDAGGFLANIATFPARLTDLAKIAPDTTWLRLSATPIFRSGALVFRADLGLDIPIDDDGPDDDALLRANFGLGFMSGATAFMFELVNIGDLDDDDGQDDFIHTFTFGVRFLSGGQVEPHVAIGLPLDDDVRDTFPFFLLFGMSARL
jgi:hypothetical protein